MIYNSVVGFAALQLWVQHMLLHHVCMYVLIPMWTIETFERTPQDQYPTDLASKVFFGLWCQHQQEPMLMCVQPYCVSTVGYCFICLSRSKILQVMDVDMYMEWKRWMSSIILMVPFFFFFFTIKCIEEQKAIKNIRTGYELKFILLTP